MRIAERIVERRGWIAVAWLVGAALLLPRARRVEQVLDVSASVEGSESDAVKRLLEGPLRSQYAQFAVMVVGGIESPARPAGAEVLRRITDRLADDPAISATFSWLDSQDTLFITPSGHGTFIIAGLSASAGPPDHVVSRLRAATRELQRSLAATWPALTLRWTGETPLNVDMRAASSADVAHAERRALPLTALLLFVAFGAIAAGLIPVVSGALAIALALGAAAIAARIWPLSILLQSVVTMLGLGLGIDYGLLMVSRFREARAAGQSPKDAAETAARHAGHTILLSAAAVAIGFVVLLTVPLNEIRAIAAGGLLVVLTSALVATTLLPGILAWLGAKVDWGRFRRRSMEQSTQRWRRLGELVTTHPWTALIAGIIPLALLATQSARLTIGLPRGDWLPLSLESTQALADLRTMGRSNIIQGVRIAVEFPTSTPIRRSAGWNALARFTDTLAADARVERVRSIIGVARAAGMGRTALAVLPDSATQGLVDSAGTRALIELFPAESLGAQQLVEFARQLRHDGPTLLGVEGARILVGGLPAFNADYSDAAAGRFPAVVGLVLAGTLMALFAGMRSVLIPLKAVALNLLSVAAAFGALTLVFQEGIGSQLFGVAEPLGAVFSTLPVIVFCIVFGLSMDYEVFLITRVLEARRSGLSDRQAIVEAVATTGHVITSAAGIMLVVFAAFTLGNFLFIKMLGFALAVAVLVDATIVRMVIGPALLQLAGRWNWWPGRRG